MEIFLFFFVGILGLFTSRVLDSVSTGIGVKVHEEKAQTINIAKTVFNKLLNNPPFLVLYALLDFVLIQANTCLLFDT